MKKAMVIISLFLTVVGNSQLVKKEIAKEVSIGKEKRGFSKFAELSYSIPVANDTIYHLFYKDENFKQMDEWKSMFFKGGSATLKDFHDALVEAINANKGKETSLSLTDNNIVIVTSRLLGKYLSISITDKSGISGLMTLTNSQIEDLFGLN